MAIDNGKEVIYVDADDEITNIIDKVGSSQQKIIALVLPKRASVFQSVVNMKLLKRRADHAKKHIVLITSEAGLLPLAGMSGLHVASTLNSKPVIPEAPDGGTAGHDREEALAEVDESDFDAETASRVPVGELAARKPRVIAPAGTAAGDGIIELDNTEPAKKAGTFAAGKAAANNDDKSAAHDVVKKPGSKGFSVPDFFRFRKRLLWIVLALVLLIVAYIVMFRVLPTGAVTITTKTDDISANVDLTLKTGITSLDAASRTVPANLQQQQKSYTQQVAATGQKNIGAKAGGSVRLTNCSQSGGSLTIPAGTGISANGLTYITQSSVTLNSSNFDFNRNCKSTGESSDNVNVTAQQAGAQYNISNTNVSVAGQPDVQGKVNGDISGGTDQVVKVVQQADIDGAKGKLNSDSDKQAMQKQLQSALENADQFAIQASFTATPSAVTTSTQADQQADTVTVSQTVTYTMFGAKRSDLSTLAKAAANKQIDSAKQSILDDGVNGASFTVPAPGSGNTLAVTMNATATAGPKLDVDSLPQQVAGKKTGDVKSLLQTTPGVTGVTVKYSPFWVTRLPSNPNKITVQFQKATGSAND